jgi:hypothetical protein
MSEQYTNLASSTNTGAIDATTNPVTIVVNAGDGALFPSTTNGPFRITVCDNAGTNCEVMLVTTRATDTFTAYRGSLIGSHAAAESPVPTLSTHSAGSIISHDLTVGALNQVRIDHTGTFTGTVLPTDSIAGDIRIPTDDVVAWVNTNTALSPFGPWMTLTAPVGGNFTWTNQGTASATIRKGSMFLIGTTQSGDQLRYFGTAVPGSTPYSLIVGIVPMIAGGNFQHIGVGFTDGTKFEHICFENSGTAAGPNIAIQRFTSTSAFSARQVEIPWISSGGSLVFFKIRNDGTNLTFSYGPSPYDFITLYSEAVAAFLGAITEYGFVLDGNNTQSGASQSMLVAHTSFGA